jgi:flagellar biosynthesis chaperone FliJ
MKESQAHENGRFETDFTSYSMDAQYYENQGTSLTNSVAMHRTELTDAEDAYTQLEARLVNKRAELKSSQTLQDKLQSQMDESRSVFKS